ncbi:phospholipase D-like domain-containing protein [Vibrio splendidus]|uniref:phospholipase D-like domain-containing protein n=1 Tax=Vibrio splendidus TaxID=29497 RepID=UPI000C814794|nr:phospholipase D-like domain-containing protein [Vibrio splendidus]PMN23468.1 restriction endonuclease [Vibrio splendidus]
MIDFAVHPNVYSTGHLSSLRSILEDMWIRNLTPGDGTIFIISGFSNYNGGARFYKALKEHTEAGGDVVAILGGSTNQRLSSTQVVEALLECGAEVKLINRKRILHAKCYGTLTDDGYQAAVISSGNFTGPGLSQNIEASVYLNDDTLNASNFHWNDFIREMLDQSWQYHHCELNATSAPFWNLLYDESPHNIQINEDEQETLIVSLVPTDTNRILARRGDRAGRGSQYFWLSKDCFDFFPPLTIKNDRGWKGTLSTFITLNYIDLRVTRAERVTFEAENNLDFRLGTGALRYQGIARPGDLACISRISDDHYELRIINQTHPSFRRLDSYAVTHIGNRGKRYGFIDTPFFMGIIR